MASSPGKYTYEFPRPAVTVDIALVTTDANPDVLLIRRKEEPYKGDWALPGGFLDPEETLSQAAQRELEEETGVTGVDLEQFVAFADPGRDPRGWTVTIVFIGRVERSAVEPKAGDDAADVGWHSLAKLPENLAFDHDQILKRVRESSE